MRIKSKPENAGSRIVPFRFFIKRRLFPLCLILYLFLLLAECQSGPELQRFDQAPLNGMVYDYRSRPVTQAVVSLDEERTIQTDINGRFVFPGTPPGDHMLGFEKEGYEYVAVAFSFQSKTQVLYVKMISLATLLDQAETAVSEKRWADARFLLDRAAAIDGDNPAVRYIEALLALYRGEAERAAAILEEILEDGGVDAVVLLSLADLYQYTLDRPAEAMEYLARYLRLREDEEARDRYERLKARAEAGEPGTGEAEEAGDGNG